MNEKEAEQEHMHFRGSVYTGEGYWAGEKTVSRAPRRSDVNYPKRRSQELREEETKGQSRAGKPKNVKGQSKAGKLKSVKGRKQTIGSAKSKYGEREKHHKDFNRNMPLHRKVFWGIGSVIVVLYIAVAIYFGLHFYSGVSVYGIDCSLKTAAQVKDEIEDKLEDYVLEIQERDHLTESIAAGQIDLQYEDDGSIGRMLKAQRSYIWPVMVLLGKWQSSPVSFSYDRSLAENCVAGLACMDRQHMVTPHDAYITPTDTGFEVAAEVMGTTLDEDKSREAILKALDEGKTQISLDEEECYINPQVFQSDETLQQEAADMSKLASANITLDFGNAQEIVDASVIQGWITKIQNGNYVIDDVCVTEYVESLAAKYDTFGLPVDFYTSIGTVVTLSGGDYGWCIDQSATVIELLNALESGFRGTMEPVYLYEGMSHENNGIGYTYVEICISKQEMWCYADGNLVVDTPVVTGNPNEGNGTPSGGVWAIDAKKRNATLVGEGYSAPVDYWMPFNGDIGIHDLQTRYYFGDTIYLSNGSHGCVNTPYEAVQEIYNTVSIGTPVIVYE